VENDFPTCQQREVGSAHFEVRVGSLTAEPCLVLLRYKQRNRALSVTVLSNERKRFVPCRSFVSVSTLNKRVTRRVTRRKHLHPTHSP
jgi:hypothetical protein